MAHREDLDVPSTVKGWGDPRPWSEVERATTTALAAMMALDPEGCGFSLAYVPFSRLGEEEGVDLSWEVNFVLPRSGADSYELAGHPAAAVDELVQSLTAAGGVLVPDRVGDLVRRAERSWQGWSHLLADVARLCCHVPDDDPGMDISVEHSPDRGAQQWRWVVSIPVPGIEYPPSEWEGSSPLDVLRAALREADTWLQGLPAGHLRD